MAILAPLCRAERKRMQKLIQKTNDKRFARRLMAMLMLHQGLSASEEQNGDTHNSWQVSLIQS